MKHFLQIFICFLLCIANVEVIALEELISDQDHIEIDWEKEDTKEDEVREKEREGKRQEFDDDASVYSLLPVLTYQNTLISLANGAVNYLRFAQEAFYRLYCRFQHYG